MKSSLRASAAVLAVACFGGLANAADLPMKPAPAAVVKAPVHHDWTGWYGGFNYGTGLVSSQDIRTVGITGTADRAGAALTAGLQAGYNWQYAPHWVIGAEGDINWIASDHNIADFGSVLGFQTKPEWFGTLRARWGYTSSPSLIYIHGGAAWTGLENRINFISNGSSSRIASGWTAGWGIETALGGGWSTKAEYLYVDAGDNTFAASGFTHTFNNAFHVFRTGYNYRLGSTGSALPGGNWNGTYGGFFAGVSASQVNATTATVSGELDSAATGFTGGLTTGINWHLTPKYVAGVEGDIGWLGIDRTRVNWDDASQRFGVKADWYGTVRGRIGLSTGPAFIYYTGGAAFVSVKNRHRVNLTPGGSEEVATGWTVGSGIEVMLRDGWTAKSEYLFIDAGSQPVLNPLLALTTTYENKFHVFRFGVNRKFGG